MKVDVFENRAIKIEGTEGTQNENNIQQLEINVPEKYKEYNKKIVFVTDDGIVWDTIEGNIYTIKRNISKYRYVSFYIWLTKDEDDFRSVEKVLRFNDNQDASDEITDEEIGKVNTVINILEEEITKVENLDLDIQKEGNKSIITITKKDGSKKSIEIYDGNGEGGGGISKYEDLPDKPRINDIELIENLTTEDLGILDDVKNYIDENKEELKGANGKDGYTPVKGVDYFDGVDGKDGVNGVDGVNGKDGYTPIKGVDYFDGKDGENGKDGYTPIKGTDYFTESDKEEMVNLVLGALPSSEEVSY